MTAVASTSTSVAGGGFWYLYCLYLLVLWFLARCARTFVPVASLRVFSCHNPQIEQRSLKSLWMMFVPQFPLAKIYIYIYIYAYTYMHICNMTIGLDMHIDET